MCVQNNLIPNQKITFSGKRLPHQSFEEFEKFALQSDFVSHISDVFQPQNFIAAGNYNSVYKITGNDTFLVRIPKQIPVSHLIKEKMGIKRATDSFPDSNFGQSIARIGKNISIIIKQQGEVFGIQNWYKIRRGKPFGKENLPEFLQKLRTIAGFNQNAYNSFAEEVKTLAKNGFYLDHNPKNILLDKNAKQINMVDIEKTFPLLGFLYPPSHHSMLNMFLDRPDFLKAYKIADNKQQKEMRKHAKTIRNKIKKAAKKTSLPENNFRFKMRLFFTGLFAGKNEVDSYNQFQRFVDSL